MSTSKYLLSAITAATITLSASLAPIQTATASAFADADDAVKYRQQGFQLIRENFAYMAAMVRGEVPFDGAMFEARAQSLHHLSHVPWDGFRYAGENHRGSGDAKTELRDNWDDFTARVAQLQEDTKNLAEASASHSIGDVRSAFMTTARNCQQCHERYRD